MNKLTIKACPLCGGTHLERALTCVDHYASGEMFHLCRCRDCGFLFTQDFPVEAEIGRYYETPDYISHTDTRKGAMNSVYHWVRNYMLGRKARLVLREAHRKEGSLLDLGTGTGYFADAMQRRGWQVEAVEKSAQARVLPRFFPQLMEKYPELDIRVTEMKTQDIQQALHAGDLDAGIIASKLEDTFLTEETLFYEQFYAYVSRKESSFKHDMIRTSDITGEHLWLLDEGHCFRDQLVRFCQMEAVKVNQMAYRLGSMETFMRMVESGKGITFIPELAVMQLTEEQRQLVRPFAIPRPTRQVVLATNKDFIRHSLLCVLKEEIKAAVPKEMLSLQSIQCLL